jgi:murein DD-endopeptidase MepM/ murein hydrolase activator NlpD
MNVAGLGAAGLLMLALGHVQALAADGLELGLPLSCEPHRTCFIQNYFDLDAGSGIRDYACGEAAYDKHTGVDFRLVSAQPTKSGVPVVASADGTVKGLRDGVEDIFIRDATSDLKGKECGNGVVLDHGNGWETQYCHMLKGSVSVAKGQTVKRGDKLGHVGYSGLADFAHVHLSVRRNGETIDPFLPDAKDGACQRDSKSTGLWQPAAIAPFAYRNGEIISQGFAGGVPDANKLEMDHTSLEPLTADSPALLFVARFINLSAGDRIRIVIDGPGGTIVEQLSEPLEKHKAVYMTYAGKKRREVPWQQGRYEARAEIVREGGVVATVIGQHDMPGAKQP